MLGLWLSLVVSMCSFTTSVSAGTFRCDGCTPLAKRQVALAAGEGEHVVYDLLNNQATGFSVEPDDQTPGSLAAYYLSVDPLINNQVAAFSALFTATGGSMILSAGIRSDDLQMQGLGGATAFDVVENANLRAQLGDSIWMNPPATLPAVVRNVIETVKAWTLALSGVSTSPKIVVTFNDGSRVVFVIDFQNQKASYEVGSSRTANGQLIPESNSPTDAAGTWTFGAGTSGGSDDPSRFILHLQSLGIPVVTNGTSVGSIRCTFDGKTLSCTAYPE